MKPTLVLLAALAALAFSLVIQQPVHKRSAHKRQYTDKIFATGQAHQQVIASESAKASSPIIDYYDDLYFANITLGSPAQTFTVMLDTGTADLWVIDSSCTTAACIGEPDPLGATYTKNRFNATASSTFNYNGATFLLNFGKEGYISGYVGTDVIVVGGSLRYAKQDILVSTVVAAPVYGQFPLDGVLGLAWPALATKNVVPVMQNLLPQLDSPLFTIWLDRHVKMAEDQIGGLITFGALDNVNCASKPTFVTLSSKTYWQFTLNKFSVTGYSTAKTQQAISDTGNSFISGPQAAIDAINKAVGAKLDRSSQRYTVPCNGTYTDLTFTIGGANYIIPSSEYVIDLNVGANKCVVATSAISGLGFAPDWILGDVWIRTYCNVHDIGNGRIGFARAKHSEIKRR